MQAIYLDHAATSFPKAPGVGAAMAHYIDDVGANMNRAAYAPAAETALTALELRESLNAAFGCGDAARCIITAGATSALNTILQGCLSPGEHVLVSAMEHNAVMRPLHALTQHGVTYSMIPCAPDGSLEVADMRPLFRKNTRLVLLTHASNVCGTILPIAQVGEECARRGIPFAVDAAQTAGHLPIDMQAMHISALALPGHKGLLGPAGIGALLLSEPFSRALRPLITGGTGSESDRAAQPERLPDKFEAGTLNLPGIFGLNAAMAFLRRADMQQLHAHAMALCARFLLGVCELPGVRLLGTRDMQRRVAVAALDFSAVLDNAQAAFLLERDYGILTRCGLHCAPAAHRTLGSYPQGAVRFSFGWANSAQEVDTAIAAIASITKA